jgi:hypothetical protein
VLERSIEEARGELGIEVAEVVDVYEQALSELLYQISNTDPVGR